MDYNNSVKTLVFGILALALSWLGITGLIFGIAAIKQAGIYAQNHYGALNGKAKTGKILGILGLIVSCIVIVGGILFFRAME